VALDQAARQPESGAMSAASEWMPNPTCFGCCAGMAPVGRSGWWCDPCQEFQ
jgi:hypothetical protein